MKRYEVEAIEIRLKENGKTVGVLRGRFIWKKQYNRIFIVNTITVSKSYRNKGIGRKLLSMIPYKAWLCVESIDGSSSKKDLVVFYQKCGFRLINKRWHEMGRGV